MSTSGREGFWKKARQRISKGSSSHGSSSDQPSRDEADNDNDKSRRRQQVYDAQKRHRNRKNEYIHSLEAELNKLRTMEAAVTAEKDKLTQENVRMQALMSQHQQPGDVLGIAEGPQSLPFATISVGREAGIQHDRLILKPHIDLQHKSQEDPSSTDDREDTWAALDFILALEWPCLTHAPHPIVTPDRTKFVACDSEEYTGHGLTMTSRVMYGSLLDEGSSPPSQDGIDKEILRKWQLPYAEIEKLVSLADQINPGEEYLTPAQVYSIIKARCPQDISLSKLLGSMKSSLAVSAHCQGFGTCIETKVVDELLGVVLQQPS